MSLSNWQENYCWSLDEVGRLLRLLRSRHCCQANNIRRLKWFILVDSETKPSHSPLNGRINNCNKTTSDSILLLLLGNGRVEWMEVYQASGSSSSRLTHSICEWFNNSGGVSYNDLAIKELHTHSHGPNEINSPAITTTTSGHFSFHSMWLTVPIEGEIGERGQGHGRVIF